MTRKIGDPLGKAVATGKAVGTGQDRAHKTFRKWVSAALKDAANARRDEVKLEFH